MRIQRSHDIAIGIEMKQAKLNTTAWAWSGHVDLGKRFAFDDPNPQRSRQDSLDRNRLHRRRHFQITFDSRQIESQKVLARLQSHPAAQLLEGNNAVSL